MVLEFEEFAKGLFYDLREGEKTERVAGGSCVKYYHIKVHILYQSVGNKYVLIRDNFALKSKVMIA